MMPHTRWHLWTMTWPWLQRAMRIVDRETFLSLPAGTVYVKWGHAGKYPKDGDLTFGDLAVKGRTISGGDWYKRDLTPWPDGCRDSVDWSSAMTAAIRGTPTAPLDPGAIEIRDRTRLENQLFGVYERVDVERLVALFQGCLAGGYLTDA